VSIKPITFSAPMVRALLAGTKTQTRRLVSKPEYYGCPTGDCPHEKQAECDASMAALVGEIARYQPGDRVYVREHWSSHAAFDGIAPRDLKRGSMIYTRADGHWHNNGDADGEPFGRHRQAMHMPRWASRLWLEVYEVRVQRLQDIDEADALAEGIIHEWVIIGANCNGGVHSEEWGDRYWHGAGDDDTERYECPIDAYAALWDSLHTELGTRWADNPWIVAYSFTVHRGNVDA
jgi:hypothetical protein